MSLSQRKKQILQAVIWEYIKTAEPVGSRTIARRYNFDLSPATIRNEMSDLEELGYLEQPYTSSGRIPSQKGYRFYVDSLMEFKDLSANEIAWIHKIYNIKLKEIDKIVQHTAKVLSAITRYTTLIMGPQIQKSAFEQLQIFPLDAEKALVILTTDTGFVENKIIELPRMISTEELFNIVGYLNRKLKGLSIDRITNTLIREMKVELIHQMEFFEQAVNLLEESFSSQKEKKVYLGGTANILSQPDFKDVSKIKKIFDVLEEETLLSKLLEEASSEDRLRVIIGEEIKIEEIQECSLITATYSLGEKTIGSIGVLGPTRMDYSKVITIVEHITQELNGILNDIYRKKS